MKIIAMILSLLFNAPLPEPVVCLSMAIYYEAGNQSITGKYAVGNVIRNRKESTRFRADTFCGVIKQKHQFTFYWDGQPEHMPRKDNALERWAVLESQIIAWLIYVGLPIDMTGGSVYYHNTTIEKPKSWGPVQVSTQVDHHIFYLSE